MIVIIRKRNEVKSSKIYRTQRKEINCPDGIKMLLLLYLAAGKPPFLIEKPAEMQCDIKNKEGCDYTFKIIQILEEFMQNNTEPCVVIQ